ncbi:MAG: hypothetical protein GY842_11115, partial [bacterium]|nr:hypothetical protein [bacterium]
MIQLQWAIADMLRINLTCLCDSEADAGGQQRCGLENLPPTLYQCPHCASLACSPRVCCAMVVQIDPGAVRILWDFLCLPLDGDGLLLTKEEEDRCTHFLRKALCGAYVVRCETAGCTVQKESDGEGAFVQLGHLLASAAAFRLRKRSCMVCGAEKDSMMMCQIHARVEHAEQVCLDDLSDFFEHGVELAAAITACGAGMRALKTLALVKGCMAKRGVGSVPPDLATKYQELQDDVNRVATYLHYEVDTSNLACHGLHPDRHRDACWHADVYFVGEAWGTPLTRDALESIRRRGPGVAEGFSEVCGACVTNWSLELDEPAEKRAVGLPPSGTGWRPFSGCPVGLVSLLLGPERLVACRTVSQALGLANEILRKQQPPSSLLTPMPAVTAATVPAVLTLMDSIADLEAVLFSRCVMQSRMATDPAAPTDALRLFTDSPAIGLTVRERGGPQPVAGLRRITGPLADVYRRFQAFVEGSTGKAGAWDDAGQQSPTVAPHLCWCCRVELAALGVHCQVQAAFPVNRNGRPIHDTEEPQFCIGPVLKLVHLSSKHRDRVLSLLDPSQRGKAMRLWDAIRACTGTTYRENVYTHRNTCRIPYRLQHFRGADQLQQGMGGSTASLDRFQPAVSDAVDSLHQSSIVGTVSDEDVRLALWRDCHRVGAAAMVHTTRVRAATSQQKEALRHETRGPAVADLLRTVLPGGEHDKNVLWYSHGHALDRIVDLSDTPDKLTELRAMNIEQQQGSRTRRPCHSAPGGVECLQTRRTDPRSPTPTLVKKLDKCGCTKEDKCPHFYAFGLCLLDPLFAQRVINAVWEKKKDGIRNKWNREFREA